MSKQRHILLVEDDSSLRNSLKMALETLGYRVSAAADGKAALSFLTDISLNCILSDIQMPHMTGLQLLKHVKANYPKLPMALMTGFSVLEETRQADEMGAAGFLSKPFVKNDLLALLQKIFESPAAGGSAKAGAASEGDYAKVSIDEFISGKSMKFDIYIMLTGPKFVKIATAGEDLSMDRIRNYKTKGLSFLYLKKEDHEKYLEFNVLLAKSIVKADVSQEKRIHFLKHANDVVMEHLYSTDLNPQSFENAKTVLEATMSVCSQQKESMGLLEALNKHDNLLYAHSLGVSMYAVMIATAMEWKAAATINKLAIGGLFHDIGKKELDPALLKKPRNELSSEEIKTYESHAARGVEILSSMPNIHDDVLQIVLQHHEDCLGTGYPGRLNKHQFHPMAKVIAVADAFCNLVVRAHNTEQMSPLAAVKRLQTLKSLYLDPAALAALETLFNSGAGVTPKAANG